jgi:hypothetical protein
VALTLSATVLLVLVAVGGEALLGGGGPGSSSGTSASPPILQIPLGDIAAPPTQVAIVPAVSDVAKTCAIGTPADPYPTEQLPYGYEAPDLWGLGSGSVGVDTLCYAGGTSGVVTNVADFTDVGGASGVLAFPHLEYGQDLWGGSPGTMAEGFDLPETVADATHQPMWLTNTYSIHDVGSAAYDYVWDNFLSTYEATPTNYSGPGNYSLEVMLWMSTGYEGSPFAYHPIDASTRLPTLINSTLSEQPWEFSYFCQGYRDHELTALFFYNGTDGGIGVSSRTVGVSFSAALLALNKMIAASKESCWSYPANSDGKLYLDNLNLGSEFLTPYPSPYFGTAVFNWTMSSMCFRFPPADHVTAGTVSCS